MIAVLWAMVVTESRMQARQRLSALLVLVLPLLTMPGALLGGEIYLGTLERATSNGSADHATRLAVAVVGSDQVTGWIEASPGLRLTSLEEAQVVARVDGRTVRLEFQSESAASRAALERAEKAIHRGVAKRRIAALTAAGLPGRPEDILAVAVRDHAAAPTGEKLGALLPVLLEFTLVMVALYTALDVISGEKERKTGESLLTSSVDRRLVTVAKGLVTTGAAAVSALVGLAAVVLLTAVGALDLPRLLGEGGEALLRLPVVAALVAAALLLALQTSGVATVLAAWVPDYRTGSMLSAPIAILLLIPASVALAPGVEGSPLLWILPIANLAIGCRDLLSGALTPTAGAVILCASAVHAASSVAVAAHLLGRQQSLVRPDGAGRRALGHTGQEAFFLFVTCAVLLWFFGQLAQQSDPVWGMVFTQVALLAAPGLALLLWLGLPIRETLSLRAPSALDLALGLVAGATMFGVAQGIWQVQDPFLPMTSAVLETLRALSLPDQPIWVPILVYGVLPAVCEETLFRGATLGLLRRSLRPAPRVAAVALAFGLLHLLLPRILPVAALGVLLGAAVLRTGSLWVAIAMHAVHNTLLVVWGRAGDPPEVSAPVLAAAAAASVAAVAAMGRVSGAPQPEPRSDLHDGQVHA